MAFKEQIAADNEKVFMNALEFSEEHIINGKKMLCIVDNTELMERRKKFQHPNFYADKIGIKEILIYVRAEDFGLLPSSGRKIIFDGKPYVISDSVNEDSIYCLTLEMNKL